MMYDVLIGSTLAEVKAFKRDRPWYKNWLEVSPLSMDRVRGISGIDSYIFLPGVGQDDRAKVIKALGPCQRQPRGRVDLGWFDR